MTTILHLSDTHFGTERPEVLSALVHLAREQRPDVAVLSGDITQRATRRQFAAARDFVERLGVPRVLAIPGNHDIPLFDPWQRLVTPYARYARAFGREREPVHRAPDLLIACVDTTRWWRHKHGEVSAAQVARVERLLRDTTPDTLRIVVTHQPVAVITPQDRVNLLRGERVAAVRRWVAAGADLILGGHIHLPYVSPLADHVRGLVRPAHAVQAGTAVSSRVRSGTGNSVNLIRVVAAPDAGRPACTVERWDRRGSTGRFEPLGQHALTLGA